MKTLVAAALALALSAGPALCKDFTFIDPYTGILYSLSAGIGGEERITALDPDTSGLWWHWTVQANGDSFGSDSKGCSWIFTNKIYETFDEAGHYSIYIIKAGLTNKSYRGYGESCIKSWEPVQ